MRRLGAALVGVALAVGGCSTITGGSAMNHYHAAFSRTVAFYAHSKVKLMGISVGTVDSVQLQGDRVLVRFSVKRSIPLPADVTAAIMPLSLIGERNLTLSPAWTAGHPVLADGAEITDTRVPVEVDDILKTITELVNALNPKDVTSIVTGLAATLKGKGPDINAALLQASSLSGTLAQQDQQLLEIAANLHQLAATLEANQQQLGSLIDDFSVATQVLAQERQQLVNFLAAVAELVQQGQVLISAVQQQLPGDVANLTRVVLTLQVNANAAQELVTSLAGLGHAVVNAFDPQLHELVVRVNLTPSVFQSLQPLFKALGLNLPCIPVGVTCP